MWSWLIQKLLRTKRRSSWGWKKLRNEYIQEHPECAVCGYFSYRNDVHHKVPRHVDPSRILDRTNLMTLCRKYRCHLRFGHFGNYSRYYNKKIEELVGDLGKEMRRTEEEMKNED